jgi:hypothetical protein
MRMPSVRNEGKMRDMQKTTERFLEIVKLRSPPPIFAYKGRGYIIAACSHSENRRHSRAQNS